MPSGVWVDTAEKCITQLAAGKWDAVFLDHDLGGETYVDSSQPNTGSEVVRWIVDNQPEIGIIVLHTLNTPARLQMAASLKNYNVTLAPFAWKNASEYLSN